MIRRVLTTHDGRTKATLPPPPLPAELHMFNVHISELIAGGKLDEAQDLVSRALNALSALQSAVERGDRYLPSSGGAGTGLGEWIRRTLDAAPADRPIAAQTVARSLALVWTLRGTLMGLQGHPVDRRESMTLALAHDATLTQALFGEATEQAASGGDVRLIR